MNRSKVSVGPIHNSAGHRQSRKVKYFHTCMLKKGYMNDHKNETRYREGVEEENFERKMFVDTCINACKIKYIRAQDLC